MSEIKVKYALSENFRKAEFARTGNLPAVENVLAFDAATLTPEQRAAIVAYAGATNSFDLKIGFRGEWRDNEIAVIPDYSLQLYVFDQAPMPALIATACAELLAAQKTTRTEYAAKLRRDIEKEVAESIAALYKMIDERDPQFGHSAGLSQTEINQAAFLGISTAERDTLKAKWESLKPDFEREAAERKAAKELADEQEKAHKAELAAKARLEKIAWANEHGSDRLRRALDAGHDCSRLYAIERAALEYPGCVLDYEKHSDWKDRSCPSTDALDTRDALIAAHPAADIKIVWLTDEPQDSKRTDGYDEGSYEDFEACEAIVIDDPEFDRFIVKIV